MRRPVPIAEHAHQRLMRDGRGARTVTVKLKKTDMTTLTRSATLPYATADAATLIATARRLLLDPISVGPIRLLGVGFSGLSDVRQESLFPTRTAGGRTVRHTRAGAAPEPDAGGRRVGDDVTHRELGHGWIQGAGHGVMTVRFESRGTGPGPVRTFPVDTADVVSANPVDSLDWGEYLRRLSPEPGEDVIDG